MNTFPGRKDDYNGYYRYTFEVDGCECYIVEPKIPREGKQWVWKAEFFSAFPAFELKMLEKGFYVAFITVGNTFGAPSALKHWDVFYKEMTGKFGFNKHAILLGLSRGGLYVYNWAAKNTDKVACIYADNAVCDFKSWPGGKGKGPGSPGDWKELLKTYGFASEQDALNFRANPIDNLEALAKAKIPLIHAVGTDDEIVPVEENTDKLEKKYKELGGHIEVIRHPGKHHPHGLSNPTPVIDFIMHHGIGVK